TKGLTKRASGMGIVVQKIDRAELVADPVERRCHLIGFADVSGDGKGLRAVPLKFFGQNFKKIGRPGQQSNATSFFSTFTCQRRSESWTDTRDNRHIRRE